MAKIHRFTVEDLSKRTGERRKMALEELLKGAQSANSLSEVWSLNPNSVYKVLNRLFEKKLVERDGGGNKFEVVYSITEQGIKKLRWLSTRSVKNALSDAQDDESDLGVLYPENNVSGGILSGPVALMRPVEVASEVFTRNGLASLPSRVQLDEDNLSVEEKYDGWLVQVVEGQIFSRRGKELSSKFANLTQDFKTFKGEHLIAELVYWNTENTQDETVISTVAGMNNPAMAAKRVAELPGRFQIMAFDLIGHEGIDISKMPYAERREILKEEIGPTENDGSVAITTLYPFGDWKTAFQNSLTDGGEGIVIKNAAAPFFWAPLGSAEPERVGTFWKVKALKMDNFVVHMSYRTPKGKLMLRFAQFWKGDLVDIGEVDSLSADMEEEFERRLLKGPVLVELAFQERYPKPPGALRNPRIRRIREDVALTEDNARLPMKYAPY